MRWACARRAARSSRAVALAAGVVAATWIWAGVTPAYADPPAPIPRPVLPQLSPGEVVRIGPTAGTGTATKDYGIGATDLCAFVEFPSQVLQVCGDSFPGQGVGFGRDYAPVALQVDTDSVDDPDGVRYTGIAGVGQPLLAEPAPPGASQLPAGVVQINRQNYLLVTTAAALVPQTSRLVKAEAGRGRWATVVGSVRAAAYHGGAQSQISGYYDPVPTAESPTGWVYVVADDFDRSQPVHLYRVAPRDFTDRSRWQGWAGGPDGGWGKAPTPLWPDLVGEMSMKQVDGKSVLSYFDASTGDMEVRVADDPTSLGAAPVTTVVRHDDWPDPSESLPAPDDNRLAQPYGGYISPGSTLDELRVFVSQWHTSDPRENGPYRVIQFAVNPYLPE